MATAPAAPAKAAAKKGIGAWYAGHKPEALIGAAGIVVTLALYVRSKNASAAASGTGTTVTPSTSQVLPGTTAPFTGDTGSSGGGDITGLESIISQLGTQISGLQGTQNQPGTGAAPAAAAAPQTFGQGLVDTAQGEMVWLGVTGAGGSTAGDYQVGGGAPVYFGNTQTLAQGGTQEAGIDVYTPVGYENLVSQQHG